MIVVTGTFKLNKIRKAAALKPVALKMLSETRKEPGCLVYEFGQLVGNLGTVRIYEEWENEEALAAHMKTPHYKSFSEALERAGVKNLEVSKFEAGERTPLR